MTRFRQTQPVLWAMVAGLAFCAGFGMAVPGAVAETPVHEALTGEPVRAGSPVLFFEPPVAPGAQGTVVRAIRGESLVAVWWQERQDRRGGIYRGRLFSLSGVPRSKTFRVSGDLTTCAGRPGVDLFPSDRILVAWTCTVPPAGAGSAGSDRPAGPVERVLWVRGFGPGGEPAGEAVPLALGSSVAAEPQVFALGAERAFVIWRGGPEGDAVWGRFVDSLGLPSGIARRLGTLASPSDRISGVRLDAGGVALAWRSPRGIVVLRADAETGVESIPLGGRVRPGGGTSEPVLADAGDGALWLLWEAGAGRGRGTRLAGRRIGPDGAAVEIPLRVRHPLRTAGDVRIVQPSAMLLVGLWAAWADDPGGKPQTVMTRFEPSSGLAYEGPVRLSASGGSAVEADLAVTADGAFATWLESGDGDGSYSLVGRSVSETVPDARPRTAEQVACGVRILREMLRNVDGVSTDPADEAGPVVDPGGERCGFGSSRRDQALARALERMLVPEGEAADLRFEVGRGGGIDQYRVEVVGRNDRGEVVAEGAFRIRVGIDAAGVPRALHLEVLATPGTDSAERLRPAGLAVRHCPVDGDCRLLGGVGPRRGRRVTIGLDGL